MSACDATYRCSKSATGPSVAVGGRMPLLPGRRAAPRLVARWLARGNQGLGIRGGVAGVGLCLWSRAGRDDVAVCKAGTGAPYDGSRSLAVRCPWWARARGGRRGWGGAGAGAGGDRQRRRPHPQRHHARACRALPRRPCADGCVPAHFKYVSYFWVFHMLSASRRSSLHDFSGDARSAAPASSACSFSTCVCCT